MISPHEAWSLIQQRTAPLAAVATAAQDALGHFLAEPVLADRDIPPADRSAMDGFAVRTDDLRQTPAELTVLGELAAGSDAEFRVTPGHCVAIYTGASLPPGADAVVMQEDTVSADLPAAIRPSADGLQAGRPGTVRILKAVAPDANVFKRGENARKGDTLLETGVRLDPAGVAICAAVGCGTVRVHPRPRVSVLSTGTELFDSATLPHPPSLRELCRAGPSASQIRNSNGPFLRAALEEQGFPVVVYETVADRPADIVAALHRAAGRSDVVLFTGGVSVGKYDLVPEAIRQWGGVIHYHGVAMKPGKPQLFASGAKGCLVFGLPGNPLSAMTGFHEFALPALRRLAGCTRCRPSLFVRLSRALSSKGNRLLFVPAGLTWTENGPEAAAVDAHGTADLVAGAKADGALIVPAGTPHVPAGAWVEFRPWRALP